MKNQPFLILMIFNEFKLDNLITMFTNLFSELLSWTGRLQPAGAHPRLSGRHAATPRAERGHRTPDIGAAQAAPRPAAGRRRVQLPGARQAAGHVRDRFPPGHGKGVFCRVGDLLMLILRANLFLGLGRQGTQLGCVLDRFTSLPKRYSHQHLLLVQNGQGVLQAERFLHPATPGTGECVSSEL